MAQSQKVDLTVRTRTQHDIELRLPPMPEVGPDDIVNLVVSTPPDAAGRGRRQTIKLNYAMVEAIRNGRDGW